MELGTKIMRLAQHLAEDADDRQFMDLNYIRMAEMMTSMSAQTERLYGISANGANDPAAFSGVSSLKRACDDLFLAGTAYANRYRAESDRPNGPVAKMLRELTADLAEDREVLRVLDFQSGMSLMLDVYNAQKNREAEQSGQREDNLPSYEEVHGLDYPGVNTLYGIPRQSGQTVPPEPDLPSQTTLRMQEGDIRRPAVQPYERVFYGTDTFYQNQMDLPSGEDLAKQRAENRRKTSRFLQIWTVPSLTHALAVSLAGKARVNSISPGWIDTTGSAITGPDALQQPVGRVGKPSDIAELALFLCSDRAGFLTGENICVDGGMTRQMIYHAEHGWYFRKEGDQRL